MLIEFSVSNFLSFNEKVSFSMTAGKARKYSSRLYIHNGNKYLKCKAISGPNASGKSNLLHAINFMQSCITGDFPRGFSNWYFRNYPENVSKETAFEIKLLIEERLITYGFFIILSEAKITNEYMYETKRSGKQIYIFKRNTDNASFYVGDFFKTKSSIDKLNIYGNDSLEDTNMLFLNIINHGKGKMYEDNPDLTILRSIYRWFKTKLTISYPQTILSGYPYFKDTNLNEIADILNALDTGIKQLKIVHVPCDVVKNDISEDIYTKIISTLEKKNATRKNHTDNPCIFARAEKKFYNFFIDDDNNITITTIEFSHEKENIYYSLSEESDGTARLLDLVEILLSPNHNAVYVIDELDRCLHPVITVKLIETFLNLAETRNTQLIFTTHESRIYASDILRNDEICFLKKNADGYSSIKSMEKYKLRADKSIYAALFDGTIEETHTFNEKKIQRIK
ncbi:AAA family ATPase [Butyrivibrio sp. WCD2001]|uniref:AAA family ATPase n=1 Tax=Butyrivibrio sp. WCD2001 TaxID=1280681 RepID=UPI0004203DAF|nr:AAA family ATPase [Butyrivibrio sp. WCD2001]